MESKKRKEKSSKNPKDVKKPKVEPNVIFYTLKIYF